MTKLGRLADMAMIVARRVCRMNDVFESRNEFSNERVYYLDVNPSELQVVGWKSDELHNNGEPIFRCSVSIYSNNFEEEFDEMMLTLAKEYEEITL